MVAVIKTGHSVHRIFNYNENKVKEGVARCIGAGNYPLSVDKMSAAVKLNYLLKQLELNTNVKRNSVHISLNFHASESHLSTEKLREIAGTYMAQIGFGKQPYLIYQHFDAAHPHIHITTIKVRRDGSRIDMNNIGRNQSEQARKSIEKEFNLVRAEAQKEQQKYHLKPVSATRAAYGKSETKRAIQNVLEQVVGSYKYTSLPELNAVLRQYNVSAERGSESSRVFQHNGLLYRILDEKGNPVGVPIKASLFYSKPTLANLQVKFQANESKRMPYKARIKNVIDMALLGKKQSLPDLGEVLGKQGIHMVERVSDTGILYGITYVDHTTQCVFNGSALGKQYSAKALQERCDMSAVSGQNQLLHSALKPTVLQPRADATAETKDTGKIIESTNAGRDVLNVLLQPEQAQDYLPRELKKGKKKKKRRNLNNNQ